MSKSSAAVAVAGTSLAVVAVGTYVFGQIAIRKFAKKHNVIPVFNITTLK